MAFLSLSATNTENRTLLVVPKATDMKVPFWSPPTYFHVNSQAQELSANTDNKPNEHLGHHNLQKVYASRPEGGFKTAYTTTDIYVCI